MDWHESAIVINVAPFNDSSSVATVLTAAQGRHRGLVYGIHSPEQRGVWQLGNRIKAEWRGRLAEQLGVFSAEILSPTGLAFLDDSLRLATIAAACELSATSLPDQLSQPAIYAGFESLLQLMAGDYYLFAFVQWEVELLAALGFGLDLSACAVSGEGRDLAFVSPRSGRAVGTVAAAPYRERLLPLPAFLLPREAAADPQEPADIYAALAGLKLSGYFLQHRVYGAHHQDLPMARQILQSRVARLCGD
ncbi:MAG: DNA repair protein RecO [Candidatus Pacebacteria bacterium]|nr:DNA repair protein RecO [Candidatus Paceibacterota bacterium]